MLPKLWELTVVLAELTPFPVRFTTCGLLLAESVIVIVPERRPSVVGLKVIVNEQDPPEEIGDVQLLIWEKSPSAEMFVIVKATSRLFVTATVALEDIIPTTVFGMNIARRASASAGDLRAG